MNPFHGRHFQGEIILWAVRWYCKYGISYRELQEMLAERGVNVDHTTIYRALLQITTNGKLKTVLAKGAAYESFPWSAFSGRNHSLGCALVL